MLAEVSDISGGWILGSDPNQANLFDYTGLKFPETQIPLNRTLMFIWLALFLLDVAVRRVVLDVRAMARKVDVLVRLGRAEGKGTQNLERLRIRRQKLRDQSLARTADEEASRRYEADEKFKGELPYLAGDDLRFVDWNIYGRLEKLFLKLFLEEQDLTVHIMADASASMTLREPSKELFIKKLTAALGYVSLVNNNRVTISFFADGIKGQLANMRGRNYLHKMAEYLLTTDCEGLSHFDNACR